MCNACAPHRTRTASYLGGSAAHRLSPEPTLRMMSGPTPKLVFAVGRELDPDGVLGVAEVHVPAAGGQKRVAHRIWNVEHGDFVCRHLPSPEETRRWLRHGADADAPPCPHCAHRAAPRFPPMSKRAHSLRTALWRAPRTMAALDAALVSVKRPPPPSPAPEQEGTTKRTRLGANATTEAIVRLTTLPDEMVVEILSWLDPDELGPALDVDQRLTEIVVERLQGLAAVHLVGLMLSAADSDNAPLLRGSRGPPSAALFARAIPDRHTCRRRGPPRSSA